MTKAEYKIEKATNVMRDMIITLKLAKDSVKETWIKNEIESEIERFEYLIETIEQE